MRRFVLPLLIFLTLPLPMPSAAPDPSPVPPPEPVEARGPDAEGAWVLSYRVARGGAGAARLALEVSREGAEGQAAAVTAMRDVGERGLPAGESLIELSFLPAEGPGAYAVALVVDGTRGAPIRFVVEEGDGGSARVSFRVVDEPTELTLTADAVNAEGKAKSPGETVVTRATLRDGNGMGDLTGLRWRLERHDGAGAAAWEEGTLGIPGGAASNATSVPVELRLARSPLPAGAWRVVLMAMKGDASVATAARGFTVRDVAPVGAGGNLTFATTGRARDLAADITVADRNGAPGPGPWEVRLYRGSTRAEVAGLRAHLAPEEGRRLENADGAGRTAMPLRVHVPANATMGAYRASLYANGTLVGAVPFEVRAPPTLREARAAPAPEGLRVAARGAGEGWMIAEVQDLRGATMREEARYQNGAGDIMVPLRAPPASWRVLLLDREAGDVVAEANGTFAADAFAPTVRLAPLHVTPRLPATWRVEAPGWSLDDAAATVDVRRWDGAPAPGVAARLVGDTLRVDGPSTLEAGRYDARLRLAFPNGTVGEASWSFEAGPWMRLRLGEPETREREAAIPLRNEGGVIIRRVVIEVAPDVATARILVDGRVVEPRALADGRRVFADLDLVPGAEAALVLRLPDGPLPAGTVDVTARVLALPTATGGRA